LVIFCQFLLLLDPGLPSVSLCRSRSRESHSMWILVDPDPDQWRATQCGSLWIRILIKGEPLTADPFGSGSRMSHSMRIMVDPDPDQCNSMRILLDPDPDQGRATQCGSWWIRTRINGELLNADPCASGSRSETL